MTKNKTITSISDSCPQATLKLIKKIAGNEKVYIVGGWLRDKLLGRANRDLDVVTAKNPLTLAKKFSRAVNGTFVTLDKKNMVYRVVLKGATEIEYIDFSKMKAPDIISDLMKRDFTVNSMAAEIWSDGELDTRNILDPSNGTLDINKRIIRITSQKSFTDDPLRMLRAFRIAAELGFGIEPKTLNNITKSSGLILYSAAERVRDELVKMFAARDSACWVIYLEKSGLLERLIPEITPMKKSARKFYFHPKGLWQHSQETLESIENLLQNLSKYFPETHTEIERHLEMPLSSGMDRKTLLKFVALLHDCAKPQCAIKSGKKTRFLGHEKKGAAMIDKILRRLRVGSREISIAKSITGSHMRPVSLSQAGTVTQKASFRLFRDVGENTPDLLLLSLADWHSYKRIKTNKPKDLKKQEAVLRELVSRYFKHKVKQTVPRLIDGNELMKQLDLEPGPLIGGLLKEVAEAQALGKISTSKEAIALASKKLTVLAKKYRIKTN